MKIRRLAATVAAAAVLTPLLVLATGAQANALPAPMTKSEQCRAALNVNMVYLPAAVAQRQYLLCMGE
ncbi:hypothetical protein ACIQF6_19275 [Kitasatospora sp. NPDC092948]|uniref:hypothetical protein n=1 Tax=Kitasatospora sp. NPDC092948 TaxID=3364088 RepID=UPI0037FD10D9